MYVCICLAVTEAEVEAAIGALPPGGCTREAVTSACRAGGDCGACHGMIESKIEDHLEGVGAGPVTSGVRCSHDEASGPQLVSAEALVRHRAA